MAYLHLDAGCDVLCLSLMFCICWLDAQIPDVKTGTDMVDAVLVDEEAVESIEEQGCGAKVLRGEGALEQFLHETKSSNPLVCFPCAPPCRWILLNLVFSQKLIFNIV